MSVALAGAALVGATVQVFQLKKETIEKKNDEHINSQEYKLFRDSFFNALKLSSINDISDIKNIYIGSGISKLNKKEFDITHLLRIFIVDILSGRYKAEENEIKNLKSKITAFINKFEESLPYEDLPQTERIILTDIETFLELDNKESVKRKIGELTRIIKTREEYLNKLERSNKNSNKVAVIGIVLTVVFGFLPFVLPFLQKWMDSKIL